MLVKSLNDCIIEVRKIVLESDMMVGLGPREARHWEGLEEKAVCCISQGKVV